MGTFGSLTDVTGGARFELTMPATSAESGTVPATCGLSLTDSSEAGQLVVLVELRPQGRVGTVRKKASLARPTLLVELGQN